MTRVFSGSAVSAGAPPSIFARRAASQSTRSLASPLSAVSV